MKIYYLTLNKQGIKIINIYGLGLGQVADNFKDMLRHLSSSSLLRHLKKEYFSSSELCDL